MQLKTILNRVQKFKSFVYTEVPLGFVSLTENLIMILMGIWMPLRMYVLQF